VTPLTIAGSRDAGEDAPAPGPFGQAGPLDSGFEGDASSLGDLPDASDGVDGLRSSPAEARGRGNQGASGNFYRRC
jgi:hypothetical protein